MATDSLNAKINRLFGRGDWRAAQKILETEREKDPQSHWVLTQLGVTLYEQRKYEAALKLFLASRRLVDDCPLTLWNLAGTLDALGKHREAARIYTWLLESTATADDDPCWESAEWTDALKTDCVYRLGLCFENLGKPATAEQCYREYLNLLLGGIDGTYSAEDVTRRIRDVRGVNGGTTKGEFRRAVRAALRASSLVAKS